MEIILKFIKDKRVERINSMWKREQEKSKLFEREYVKERDKRIALESVILNEKEKAYILELLLMDEVLNSQSHTSEGLYTKLDTDFLDFVYTLRSKIKKM